MSADDEGAMARLVNYDNGTTVDSVLVADGMAVFEGQIDAVAIAGKRRASLSAFLLINSTRRSAISKWIA